LTNEALYASDINDIELTHALVELSVKVIVGYNFAVSDGSQKQGGALRKTQRLG
jgi:hypothetical protein